MSKWGSKHENTNSVKIRIRKKKERERKKGGKQVDYLLSYI